MQEFYPDYYKKFKCIANLCPDSCCQGWDVVVDEKSESFYNSIKGDFGDKIKQVTVTDEDGDRIFTLQNGRCPFWNKDELCDIYINLGEEHLCKTCEKFPRITMGYDSFNEYTLSLACPEAAKIILNEEFIIPNKNYNIQSDAYHPYMMKLLLNARIRAQEIITDTSLSFKDRLKNLVEYNIMINEKLFSLKENKTIDKDISFIFDIHERLEYINEEYSIVIKKAADYPQTKDFDEIYTRMAVYYLYRYYLNAIYNKDALNAIKKIFCSYIITASIACSQKNPDIVRIIQNYSKEVEHSYENMETLDFFFENDERFSGHNLISLLE